jgi:hypothetical protein
MHLDISFQAENLDEELQGGYFYNKNNNYILP